MILPPLATANCQAKYLLDISERLIVLKLDRRTRGR